LEGRDVVTIGGSSGGVEALARLVSTLPADLPAAVPVVVHFPEGAPSALPRILSRSGPLEAVHPGDGDLVEKGRIYVAPPGLHLLVERMGACASRATRRRTGTGRRLTRSFAPRRSSTGPGPSAWSSRAPSTTGRRDGGAGGDQGPRRRGGRAGPGGRALPVDAGECPPGCGRGLLPAGRRDGDPSGLARASQAKREERIPCPRTWIWRPRSPA
jgi:hypothetical protein